MIRKITFYFILFTILSIIVHASWETYQKDLRNTGNQSGTGNFPLSTANYSDNSIGMDFQPLVSDLNANGSQEIVIFSNNSLIIFDYRLVIITQMNIGATLGQPTLFNFDNDSLIEVIFNARQNSSDYFFAYQFNNSNLKQEFNITLSHEANFSGIKCFEFNGTNYCVFKDEFNYVNVINMSSKIGNFYNTSIYEEVRHTVPAIGDIDNDGNFEAVFWFNEDNNSGYGFLVFDLISRSLETNFNNSGIVDNIFNPIILGPSLFHQLFELKGQPVLVDLNNDNKLEIAASVFYDDYPQEFTGNDRFTELFVYSPNGTKLFSKCGMNTVTNQCNDGSSEANKWDGTNPFVLDYDKNGLDDICLIKSVQKNIGFVGFENMSLNCYNYSGDEIANVNLSNSPDGIKGTAMAADMDNDGEKEIIISHSIFKLNGAILFGMPSLSDVHPIAVDVDGNNGLDLVWTFGNKTKTYVSNASTADLEILEMIPIQVVRGVDMVLGKTGLVRVNVKNNGPLDANATVAITLGDQNLAAWNNENNTKFMLANTNASFDFRFKPILDGTQTFIGNVSVS